MEKAGNTHRNPTVKHISVKMIYILLDTFNPNPIDAIRGVYSSREVAETNLLLYQSGLVDCEEDRLKIVTFQIEHN